MKKRIDLFSQQISSRELVDYLRKTRTISLYIFIGLLGFIVLLSGVYLYFSSQLTDLSDKKRTYNRYIVLNTPFVQDLRRFAVKFSLLKSMLQEDAHSYSYYQHLITITSAAPVKGSIVSFKIDHTQNTEFILRFISYDDAIAFIEYSEKSAFLENFTMISLNAFQIQNNVDDSYELHYSGSFIKLP
jgi:hypothetical protein